MSEAVPETAIPRVNTGAYTEPFGAKYENGYVVPGATAAVGETENI